MQIKREMAVEVAAKERRSQPTKAKYQALQRKLSEEVEKRRKGEQASDSLRDDVERAKCASVDLLKRFEACRTAYDAQSLKIKSHNGLQLREIEHREAKLIAGSGRRHRRLSKKLELYLIRSCDAVANLEVELVNVLKGLGLERKLEGAATVNFGGV
ncbi:hypothetical protein AXG93_4095s1000 [Marchantia polymorpha subsp. ruderalis]|uniref:Uncharacterized protein n=1 Tax=Marchantia polymorpha subsp. ruderalis TaxID=1480154 RepID=A0A176VER2_MARPO|nr:hypothetical protein AXG93_4095s1000 [Marchantia polymorpha subsp. ruderalis]